MTGAPKQQRRPGLLEGLESTRELGDQMEE
jgi:hypothetical protein